MASSEKTSYLGLNQWLGKDKPKREDFNQDNAAVDQAVEEHCLNSEVHITQEERQLWNSGAFVLGSYTGSGVGTMRSVELGFRPRLLLIYTVGKGIVEADISKSTTNLYSAIGCEAGCTYGLSLTDTGFTVRQNPSAVLNGDTCQLNIGNTTYVYVAYR